MLSLPIYLLDRGSPSLNVWLFKTFWGRFLFKRKLNSMRLKTFGDLQRPCRFLSDWRAVCRVIICYAQSWWEWWMDEWDDGGWGKIESSWASRPNEILHSSSEKHRREGGGGGVSRLEGAAQMDARYHRSKRSTVLHWSGCKHCCWKHI